jgi:tRNA(Arg) A34 adenosine deaminase TadA
MCSSVAYWAGIRRIVYAVPKSQVNPLYYETSEDTTKITESFHEKIERIHIPELQEEALTVVRSWEEKSIK